MRLFTVYRPNIPEGTHDENQANGPLEAQFQGVVFDDRTVIIKWLTAVGSISIFENMTEMLKIHGHPEYGTELYWHDVGVTVKANI